MPCDATTNSPVSGRPIAALASGRAPWQERITGISQGGLRLGIAWTCLAGIFVPAGMRKNNVLKGLSRRVTGTDFIAN